MTGTTATVACKFVVATLAVNVVEEVTSGTGDAVLKIVGRGSSASDAVSLGSVVAVVVLPLGLVVNVVKSEPDAALAAVLAIVPTPGVIVVNPPVEPLKVASAVTKMTVTSTAGAEGGPVVEVGCWSCSPCRPSDAAIEAEALGVAVTSAVMLTVVITVVGT